MTAGVLLSIDAGQTSVRVRVRDASGVRVLAHPGVLPDRSAVEQVADLLDTHRGLEPTAVAVGLSGFGADRDAAARLLDRAPTARRAILAHDSVTGYLGANGDADGAVAAVGTGVVVLGVGPSGVARVDGWGAILGDDGSAYWLGRAGLAAALRATDGRGPRTSLIPAALSAFGPIEHIYLAVQADPHRVANVAGFAPAVTAAAEQGDAVAGAIVERAAQELVHSLSTALARVGADPATARVSAVGRVTGSASMRRALRAELVRRFGPDGSARAASLAEPVGQPIDGVERLHELPSTHALASVVVTAER
ncbi:BadF/BadG/BcrA/BcrD ATPase family protein [Agromyces aurantiacus]|uniref:BadF/BadG/BcrA/BcrD ATPase family protein n=1 Tax=Agromyces aurantiacus TaxID=165814 RepID=A0ABV9R528_9MICO|nr:BadF/BadG/BcrA/BcrD ATPase family protein [Agromyces aurantiacus]MBM7503610.1 N-acetylglucosamine kinase-like BadF-type ATPase [Agromyces aurantiacus]